MCAEVGLEELQMGEELLTRYISIYVSSTGLEDSRCQLSIEDSWPEERPVINWFQDQEMGSKATMSLKLDCTCNWSRVVFQ